MLSLIQRTIAIAAPCIGLVLVHNEFPAFAGASSLSQCTLIAHEGDESHFMSDYEDVLRASRAGQVSAVLSCGDLDYNVNFSVSEEDDSRADSRFQKWLTRSHLAFRIDRWLVYYVPIDAARLPGRHRASIVFCERAYDNIVRQPSYSLSRPDDEEYLVVNCTNDGLISAEAWITEGLNGDLVTTIILNGESYAISARVDFAFDLHDPVRSSSVIVELLSALY